MEVNMKLGTLAANIYRNTRATERYYCNFGFNPAYQDQLVGAGLVISGTDQAGEARIMELPSHPFFTVSYTHLRMAHSLALDSIDLSVNGHSESTASDNYEPARISSGC